MSLGKSNAAPKHNDAITGHTIIIRMHSKMAVTMDLWRVKTVWVRSTNPHRVASLNGRIRAYVEYCIERSPMPSRSLALSNS
jgi:hypothetical protein